LSYALLELTKNEFGKWTYNFGFNFDVDIINAIIQRFLRIIIIAIGMYIVIKVGNKLIENFVDKQVKSKLRFTLDNQKAITIGEVLKSVLKYLVYFLGVTLMFSDIFSKIPVAVASVGGVAIGFGAQSLVKDLINGLFILFEDQYGVGDHITVGQFTGIVESIGIRTTIIRDFTGDLHLIPNGNVLEVTNHSRGDIRFVVDVKIAYEENVDRAIEIIKETNKSFQEKHSEELRGDIEVLGIVSLNVTGVTIRVVGRAKPLSQWTMERELRKEIRESLDREGIEVPHLIKYGVNEVRR
jgi:small conductance mechanosensitive channel